MQKAGFEYKLPDMSSVKERIDRARNLPGGEFVLEVYKIRPKVTRDNKLAIIAEFKVIEIINQVPGFDKSKNELPLIIIGQRVDQYMEMGGQYGYGETEWANLMDALGVPPGERNEAQKAFLGEENLACGQQVRVRRDPPKTFFSQVKAVAA